MASNYPKTFPASLKQAGVLPYRRGPVRFAVGPPDGITSNSWNVKTKKSGIYISCRDNFKDIKVSLHASSDPLKPGRWRVGYTEEAINRNKTLLAEGENRAWEVWDEPPETMPNIVKAFSLIFPTSELAVTPQQRPAKEWKDVIFIEEAPSGKLTVITLFVTNGAPAPTHRSERSFHLASLDVGNGRRADLVAHAEPEGDVPDLIRSSVATARSQVEAAGIHLPSEAYGYFHGHWSDGCRFVFCARLNP